MANGTLKVSNIQTSSGSGTITLGASGETVDLSNGTITLNSSMKNTPNFLVKRSGNQSISLNTTTKVQFDSETYDSASAYDNSSNYRFTVPTGKGGKYFITAQVNLKCNSGNNLQTTFIALYINGSAVNTHHKNDSAFNTSNLSRRDTRFISTILDLSAGDYVEVYAQLGDNNHSISGSGIQANNAKASSFFAGYKLIGV